MTRCSCIILLAGTLACGPGCGHVGGRRVALPKAGTGASSARFLEAPPASAAVVEPDPRPRVYYVAPCPAGPLTNPRYPPAARGAKLKTSVAVRFTVEESGRVTEVRSSPVAFTMPSPFEAAFRAEGERAVRTWRFTPAEKLRLEWVEEAGGATPCVVGREKIAWDLDVEFTFDPAAEESRARPK